MSTEGTYSDDEVGSTGYEIFIGALSLLSLLNLVLYALMHDASNQQVIQVMDLLFSFLFLADFSMRMVRADSKSGYFFRQFGWADLLGSLPFPQVKVLRIFRVLRVYRLLRRYGIRRIMRSLLTDRAGSALYTLLFIGIVVLQFGSLGVLHAEKGQPGANIETAGDALWYSIVTMSTVGYGDKYPVTPHGREIGTLIIIVGVGIFGTLTGFLANVFLSPKSEDGPAVPEPVNDVNDVDDVTDVDDAPRERLRRLRALLEDQQRAVAELEQALGD